MEDTPCRLSALFNIFAATLQPQAEDAPCRGDRDPYKKLKSKLTTLSCTAYRGHLVHDINNICMTHNFRMRLFSIRWTFNRKRRENILWLCTSTGQSGSDCPHNRCGTLWRRIGEMEYSSTHS